MSSPFGSRVIPAVPAVLLWTLVPLSCAHSGQFKRCCLNAAAAAQFGDLQKKLSYNLENTLAFSDSNCPILRSESITQCHDVTACKRALGSGVRVGTEDGEPLPRAVAGGSAVSGKSQPRFPLFILDVNRV